MQNAAAILTGNVAMNNQIRYLKERWQCNMNTCHSEGPHFPLGHDHISKLGVT